MHQRIRRHLQFPAFHQLKYSPVRVPYRGNHQPKLKVGVRFDVQHGATGSESTNDLKVVPDDLVGHYDKDSMRDGVLEFKVPTLERVISLDVPEQRIYSQAIDELVRRRPPPIAGTDSRTRCAVV